MDSIQIDKNPINTQGGGNDLFSMMGNPQPFNQTQSLKPLNEIPSFTSGIGIGGDAMIGTPVSTEKVNIPKPSPVVSSSIATNKINNVIKPTLDTEIKNQQDVQEKNDATKLTASDIAVKNASAPVFTNETGSYRTETRLDGNGNPYNVNVKVSSPQQSSTAEDKIASQPSEGNQHVYNLTSGEQSEVPVGDVPPGFSSQNPKTRTDVSDSVDVGDSGITFKKFSDGTYGRFNLSTGDYTQANAGQFNSAKSIEQLNNNLDNARNGIYSDVQKAQIDTIKQQAEDAINKQVTTNANITGAVTLEQNMFGIGNTSFGKGAIQKTIEDGTKAIMSLQASRDLAIAKLKESFITDDSNAIRDAFAQFNYSNREIQGNLDKMQQYIQRQSDKESAKLESYMYQQINNHPDAAITPNMTFDEIQKAVIDSPSYKSKQSIVDTTPIDTRKPNQETGNIPSSITGLSPNSLWQFANDYALSGKSIQSYVGGLSSKNEATAAKDAIRNKSAALTSAAGVDIPTLQQQFKNMGTAGRQQMSFLNQVDRALDAAEKSAQLTQQLFNNKGIDPYSSTWINKTINDLNKQFGDSGDIRAYKAAMVEVGNEYAQVFARGGQRSVEGNALALSLVNSDVKLQDIQKTLDSLQRIGGTVVNSSINQLSKIKEGYGADEVAKYLKFIHSVPTSSSDETLPNQKSGAGVTSLLRNPNGTLKALRF